MIRFLEPKIKISKERQIFSNQDLKHLILPLLVEQLLLLLVGMIDTLMISYAGEVAVSGVSLVNQINSIFIAVFTALASGGAVVISQYIGKKDRENGILSANQLLLLSIMISLIITILILIFCNPLLNILFGQVERDVMKASQTYLLITALSFPALAIYNSSSSILRSMSLTKITMYVSITMNMINVIGSYIGVFILNAGVAQSFWSIAALFSIVMGLVFITVIGQCVGANDYEAVQYYVKKLLKITYLGCVIWDTFVFILTPFILKFYSLSLETIQLVIFLCFLHNIMNAILHPSGFVLANALRATGDVKYTMYASMFSTVIVRVVLSIVLGVWMNLGVIGVAIAMGCDWLVRVILIVSRYRSGQWKKFKVI